MHSAKFQTALWLITSSPEQPEIQSNVQHLMACVRTDYGPAGLRGTGVFEGPLLCDLKSK